MTLVNEKEEFLFPVACHLLEIPRDKLVEYGVINSVYPFTKSYDVNVVRKSLEEMLMTLTVTGKEISISPQVKEKYGKCIKETMKALIYSSNDHLLGMLKVYKEEIRPKMEELMECDLNYLKLLVLEAKRKFLNSENEGY